MPSAVDNEPDMAKEPQAKGRAFHCHNFLPYARHLLFDELSMVSARGGAPARSSELETGKPQPTVMPS